MDRTLISELSKDENEKVLIQGRVANVRALSNLTFIQVFDYSGSVQVVFEKNLDVKVSEAIEVTGTVKKDERAKSGYEIQGEGFQVLSACIEDLPIDISKNDLNLQLNTLLDERVLSLRHPKVRAIFKIFDLLLEGYEKVMREEGFSEIKTPKLLETASEGGANFFKVSYFEQSAYLAQSPQLYKQIMTGVFERVFEIGTVFRAEPHFTTRHMNEFTGLDAEMAMIKDMYDVTAMLSKVLKGVFEHISENGKDFLELYSAEVPVVPNEIPHKKLSEIRAIIKDKYNYDIPETTDIDPEGERLACRYAKEEFKSDFIFITHYEWKDKPFYTMPDPENEKETLSYDLLYRGVEIASGGQRIHDYKMLKDNIEKKKINPEGLESYLNTFKYGLAPHGGWGLGADRIVQLILGLASVKEACLFPRDVKRLNP